MNRDQAYKIIELIDFVGDNAGTLIPSFEARMRVIDLLNVLKVDLTVGLQKEDRHGSSETDGWVRGLL